MTVSFPRKYYVNRIPEICEYLSASKTRGDLLTLVSIANDSELNSDIDTHDRQTDQRLSPLENDYSVLKQSEYSALAN